ncbi:MAG TPA: hypothetical protein DEG69_20610, partial [Flavobacteriaceae bacterium]|nr:hypothetical protein [Flavobacteriaceae bacterium]
SNVNQPVNISALANGVYVVKVKTSEGTYSKRIIKNNKG